MYIFHQTGNENTQTYQVEVFYVDLQLNPKILVTNFQVNFWQPERRINNHHGIFQTKCGAGHVFSKETILSVLILAFTWGRDI